MDSTHILFSHTITNTLCLSGESAGEDYFQFELSSRRTSDKTLSGLGLFRQGGLPSEDRIRHIISKQPDTYTLEFGSSNDNGKLQFDAYLPSYRRWYFFLAPSLIDAHTYYIGIRHLFSYVCVCVCVCVFVVGYYY